MRILITQDGGKGFEVEDVGIRGQAERPCENTVENLRDLRDYLNKLLDEAEAKAKEETP